MSEEKWQNIKKHLHNTNGQRQHETKEWIYMLQAELNLGVNLYQSYMFKNTV